MLKTRLAFVYHAPNNLDYLQRIQIKKHTHVGFQNLRMQQKRTNAVLRTASIENLEHLLGKRIVAFSIDQQQSSIGLCQSHYSCMYSQLHQASPCHSCGIIPKKDEPFTRHCPSPVEIHKYLTHITGEPSNLAQFVMVAIG